jgi:hypothetical protein
MVAADQMGWVALRQFHGDEGTHIITNELNFTYVAAYVIPRCAGITHKNMCTPVSKGPRYEGIPEQPGEGQDCRD